MFGCEDNGNNKINARANKFHAWKIEKLQLLHNLTTYTYEYEICVNKVEKSMHVRTLYEQTTFSSASQFYNCNRNENFCIVKKVLHRACMRIKL